MTDSTSAQAVLRRRAVALAVALTADTPLAPNRYERQLLARYEAGELTIDEVLARVEEGPYHVLYRSQATPALTAADLQTLLDRARTHNAEHQLTGLLLYGDGCFVQLVEGPKEPVRALYARMQQDARHTHVVMLSDGPGPQRWFADWHMAFCQVAAPALYQVLGAVEDQTPLPVPITEPHLQTLLHAFSSPSPSLG